MAVTVGWDAWRVTDIASPILQVDDLGVTYRRGEQTTMAIERIDLQVAPGEFVCIVGASGCGKTTLLRAIKGLIEPTHGTILLHGRPRKSSTDQMAMVFQQDSLMPWRTTLQNVMLGLELKKMPKSQRTARARECIDLVKLNGFEQYYPHELSGGMRQRVNLARGLAVDPDVLLMDEPFAALDAQTREAMQQELLVLCSGQRKTVVFITHQLDEAVFLGDRVIVLGAHPGRVREEIVIDLPRPRSLTTKRSPEFSAYVDRIWKLIEQEVYDSLIDDKDDKH